MKQVGSFCGGGDPIENGKGLTGDSGQVVMILTYENIMMKSIILYAN